MNRIRAGWTGAAVLVLLSGCRVGLHSDLGEPEANQILVCLAQAGLAGHKERSGSGARPWSIRVAEADLPAAVQVLRAVGLPRAHHRGFKEVYAERGLVPGRLEERALFLSALQAEIAESLESVDGVISARVHATIRPEQVSARLGSTLPVDRLSASVLITHGLDAAGQVPLSEKAVQKIVANAIDGLQADQVAVVFSPRALASPVASLAHPADQPAVWLRWVGASVSALALLACLGWLALRRFRGADWPFARRA
jgi:type III secretion protein J